MTASIPREPTWAAVGIRRAERLVKAQSERIGIAEAALYPRISLLGAFEWQADLVASRASAVLNLIGIYRALGGGWEIRLPHGGQGLPLEYTVTWEPVRPIGEVPEIEQPVRPPDQPLEAVPTVPSEPREPQPSSADRERFRKLLERLQLDQQEREDHDVERQLEELLRRRDQP